MKHKILLKALSWFFTLQFILVFIGIVGFIIAHVAPLSYKFDSGTAVFGPSYAEGAITIPVDVQTGRMDTTISTSGLIDGIVHRSSRNFSGKSKGASDRFKNPNLMENPFPHNEFDSIISIDTVARNLVSDGDPIHTSRKVKSDLQMMKARMKVYPEESNLFVLGLIGNYLYLIFLILFSYQMLRIIWKVNKTSGFSKNLGVRVRFIGMILIVYSILKFIVDILITSEISLGYSLVEIGLDKNFNTLPLLHINPYLGFEFQYLIAGLLLIILGSLIKNSANIEEQWSLIV